jgi:hypothetical protein
MVVDYQWRSQDNELDVTQDEHKVYPGLGHELRNTLRPTSLWIVLIRDDEMF